MSAFPRPFRCTRALPFGNDRLVRAIGVIPLLAAAACISSIRSTEGGRREARRECLAAARNVGWLVIDIGDARFTGAARYEVTLVVEMDSIPRHPIRCAYDSRLGLSELLKTTS